MFIESGEFCSFLEGGWQLQASFSQSFLLQFWKSQCPSGSKYPEFSKTPPAFAFWMSLKVVVAIFPRNDIFFGTPCTLLSGHLTHCLQLSRRQNNLHLPLWGLDNEPGIKISLQHGSCTSQWPNCGYYCNDSHYQHSQIMAACMIESLLFVICHI